MMDDRVARIQKKMLGIQQEMLKVVTEELQGWMNDLMKDMLDPAKIMGFIRSMGIDPSKLPGMMTQQPGFDPYQILGLDKSASDEGVKKRYRELIHKLHPDTAGVEGTSFLLNMVLAAYNLIKMQRGWQ
jgi:hypothetical protein